MKLCQVCQRISADTAATCPVCGEASWTVVEDSGVAPKEVGLPCKQDCEGAIPSGSTKPFVSTPAYASKRNRRG